jgi:S-adenosylmethionine decarboxylase
MRMWGKPEILAGLGVAGFVVLAGTQTRCTKPPPTSRKVQPMQGLHLTADLHHCRCDAAWLTDAARLGAACMQAVDASGLQAVAQLLHTFPSVAHTPGGVTATILLAESHLCVHTWPEKNAVTLDVYVCNFGGNHSAKAHALMAALLQIFQAAQVTRHSIERGAALAPGVAPAAPQGPAA